MKIIEPSFELINPPDYSDVLRIIEMAARTCYKSESKGEPEAFIKKIIGKSHLSTIEHASLTARIICDRGVSHELVRHRIASVSQESTRYNNYSKDKFGNELTFIRPCFWDGMDVKMQCWEQHMLIAEQTYLHLIKIGASAQEARAVLPNSLKTEVIVTANIREWRHIFNLRCSRASHPQMVQVMEMGLAEMRGRYPVFFDDGMGI